MFGQDKDGIKKIATDGALLVKELADKNPQINIDYQYSPESFSDTELDYALDVCNAVMEILQPSAG